MQDSRAATSLPLGLVYSQKRIIAVTGGTSRCDHTVWLRRADLTSRARRPGLRPYELQGVSTNDVG